ncbi:MAG: hypothetical protein RLZZ459_1790 [Cyanobacteriota bacterium]
MSTAANDASANGASANQASANQVSRPAPAAHLDLRGTPCPLNYIRSKLALEKLQPGDWLQVDLDAGEPEQMVAAGLNGAGHRVLQEPLADEAVRLLIRRAGADSPAAPAVAGGDSLA